MSQPHHPCLVVVINDLIFETRIQSTARSFDLHVHRVSSADALPLITGEYHPTLVIFDLNSAQGDVLAAIGRMKAEQPRPRVVAFCSHVDEDLMSRARDAGADEVLARSRFTHDLPTLIQQSRIAALPG